MEKLNSSYETYKLNLEKWQLIKKLEEEIKNSDPYFENKVNNRVSIQGLPNNSILICNGEEYLLDSGSVSFDGGAKLDFSKIYKSRDEFKLFLEAKLKDKDISYPVAPYDFGFNVGMHRAYNRVLEKLKEITK